jgi:secondary thiamine-phosphate synthase enzyme
LKLIGFETQKGDVVDLTAKVEAAVEGVKEGLVNVFAPHATGVLIIGENEPNIARDYVRLMEKLAPERGGWAHDKIDDNAHAHLRSVMFGASLTIPVKDGKLALGTWQRIMFMEFDGARHRRVIVTVVSGNPE